MELLLSTRDFSLTLKMLLNQQLFIPSNNTASNNLLAPTEDLEDQLDRLGTDSELLFIKLPKQHQLFQLLLPLQFSQGLEYLLEEEPSLLSPFPLE